MDSISEDDSDELTETKIEILQMLRFLSTTPDIDDDDSEENEPQALN